MPGTLFVLVRERERGTWHVTGAGLTAAEAQQAVTEFLAKGTGQRLVVANGIRSFVATTTVTEDPQVVIEA